MKAGNLVVIVGLIVLLAAPTATADWFDDFSGNLDAWDFDNMTAGGTQSATFSAQIVSGALELKDATFAGLGGAAIGLGYLDQTFAGDVTVYGTLNPNNDSDMNQTVGLFVRGIDDDAYAMGVDYGTGTVQIVENSSSGQTPLGDSDSIADFDNTWSLYAEFTASGTSLSGSVYDQKGGTLLASVSATDDSYSSGVAGVAVQVGDPAAALRGTFDNVGAVPEPSSMVLLGSGGLCALGCLWRKRRRGKK